MRTPRIIGLILLLAAPAMVTGQPFEGNIEVGVYARRGLKYETGLRNVDTLIIEDPFTGGQIVKTRLSNALPALVNGRKVYQSMEVTLPELMVGAQPLEEYILNALKEAFLSAGNDSITVIVDLHHLVIDEQGKLVYYELEGFRGYFSDGMMRMLSPGDWPDRIAAVMADLPTLKPALRNGMPVAAIVDTHIAQYRVQIQKPLVKLKRVNG